MSFAIKILKKIYSNIPFKKHLFTFLKRIWSPPERIYKHLHFTGVIKIRIDKLHFFKMKHYGYQIENEIFWSGLISGWGKKIHSFMD
jgi:hypothetical protein